MPIRANEETTIGALVPINARALVIVLISLDGLQVFLVNLLNVASVK